MLALLLTAALFAGGALFIKYKLEELRASVQRHVESRTGARLRAGAVLVNGLRGLRIDNVGITLDSAAGPSIQVDAPVIYVYINLIDLLYGEMIIDRVQADGATFRLTRPDDKPWIAPDSLVLKDTVQIAGIPAFRFLGSDCTLEIENVAADTRMTVSAFHFDISRLTGSPDISAKLAGALGNDPKQQTSVNLRFASMEDFDLRVQSEEITAEDLAMFLPASQRFVESGAITPSIRVAGYPGMTLVVAFETPFRSVALRNQPPFILPATGTLSGVASYDSNTHRLTLTAAKAESEQIGGRVEGFLSFDGPFPAFDVVMEATRLPVTDALDYSLQGRTDEYGTIHLQLEEPCQLQVRLQGTTDAPSVSLQGNAVGGVFAFTPKDPLYPKCDLKLSNMMLTWASKDEKPVGSFNIASGVLTHASSGLSATDVTGALVIENNTVRVDPLNAKITGNPFVGNLKYDMATEQLELTAEGTVSNLEKTLLASISPDISISGAVGVQGHMVRNAAKCIMELDLDATQCALAYKWWLSKPPGIGAQAKKVRVDIRPGRSLSFSGDAAAAGSQFSVEGSAARKKRTWQMQRLGITSEKLDVVAVGKCLKIPYRVSGGTATGGKSEWTFDQDGHWQMKASTRFDELALLPDGAEIPLRGNGVQLECEMKSEPNPTGNLTLAIKDAHMPPLAGDHIWFARRTDAEQNNKPDLRAWTFKLSADAAEVPPWKGSHFKGEAYVNAGKAGLNKYTADIAGGGRIEGAYHRVSAENTYDVAIKWSDIPATYLIEQLNYPRILTGKSGGEFHYSMDKDDPNTLKGDGAFEIHNGQFSADFLISQIEGRLENRITSLPLSLRFENFSTNVALEKDHVKTSDIKLASPGINVAGEGSFVRGGDMDYNLRVALSPEMAEKIPALRDNLNIQGLRLAQQNLELAFKVTGPTFNPQGELSQAPPIGITLVSSALEATSDAVKVIDIPRKILLDLLRIGGGIVGASK